MENENLKVVTPSYVGPLAAAEDSADKFVSGIVYCTLLEKLFEQQLVLNDLLSKKGDLELSELTKATEDYEALEKVWCTLGEEFGYEC